METIQKHIDKVVNNYERRYKAKDIALNTLDSARNQYRRLGLFWGSRTVDQITEDEWENYQDWHDDEFKGQGRSNELKFFNYLVKRLHRRGIIKIFPEMRNRNAKIEELKRAGRNDRVFTGDELKTLFNDPAIPLFKRQMFLLGYQCAMRFSETANLTWGRLDLDPKDPTILFNPRDHKTNVKKIIPITPLALKMFKSRKGRRKPKPDDLVFLTDRGNKVTNDSLGFRKILDDHGLEEGEDHFTRYHSFRRTRFTDLCVEGRVPHPVICKELRIKIETLLNHYYQSSSKSRDALRAAA